MYIITVDNCGGAGSAVLRRCLQSVCRYFVCVRVNYRREAAE